MRPSWDEYFMEITETVARRATCLRRQIGALIVRDNRILTTGYNGAPSGLDHCLDTGCLREAQNIPSGERHELCRAIHAEQNAIIQAALHGISIKDATIYITNQPCVFCAKMIIQAGIKRVVYQGPYPDQLALAVFKEAGTQLEVLGGE